MERLSKKSSIFAPSSLRKGWLEESYDALTRQITWKVKEYGREVEGCSSCMTMYCLSPKWSGVVYTCRCELISILAYSGIPGPSDREC